MDNSTLTREYRAPVVQPSSAEERLIDTYFTSGDNVIERISEIMQREGTTIAALRYVESVK